MKVEFAHTQYLHTEQLRKDHVPVVRVEALRILSFDHPERHEEYRDLYKQYLADEEWWATKPVDNAFKSWIVAKLVATLPKESS